MMENGWRMVLTGEDHEWLDFSTRNNMSARNNMDAVRRCVSEYCALGAVREIDKSEVKALNPLTMVVKPDPTKPSGLKERMCIDVSRFLNPRIPLSGFRMVTVAPHYRAFRKGIWMAKIDLTNGYFHIKIQPDQQGYLAFSVDNKFYCFERAPFGINSLPKVFQALMNEALRPLFEQFGIICESYLDDIWIQADSASQLRRFIKIVKKHLELLGFMINHKKSILEPVQEMEYLGIIFDSKNGCLRIPPEKQSKGLRLIDDLLRNPTLRSWQKTVGFLEFLTYVSHEGKSHLSSLFANYASSNTSYKVNRISPAARYDLLWWKRYMQSGKVRFVIQPIAVIYESDASAIGGGLTCVKSSLLDADSSDQDDIAIEWSREDTHSNIRELDMVRVLLERRGKLLRGLHVHVKLDNTSSVSVVNKGGSSSAALNRLSRQIWSLRNTYRISLSASYLPGDQNTVADALSRRKESPVIRKDATPSIGHNVAASKYVPIDPETCEPQDPRDLPRLAIEGLGFDPLASVAVTSRYSRGYDWERSVTVRYPQLPSVTEGYCHSAKNASKPRVRTNKNHSYSAERRLSVPALGIEPTPKSRKGVFRTSPTLGKDVTSRQRKVPPDQSGDFRGASGTIYDVLTIE